MNTTAYIRDIATGKGRYEYVQIQDSDLQRAVPQANPVRLPAPNHHSHPVLIAGLVIGLFVGLLACLPASVRGWVVVAILVGIGWVFWSANRQQPFVAPPGDVQVYSDYAPRAGLVKLPGK
jgi:hypothetical protein